ncbi:MAG: hypothetical protein IJO33_04495 [Bacilli bacterium]|nr:hypothetical protein [Bacilli bacterium]
MDKIQLQKDIEEVIKKYCQTKDLCRLGFEYAEYEKAFAFTNENLFELYHKLMKDRYHSALTVLSSGDHAFNLIYHDVMQIDTFDCNRLTEYYSLGFKKTALEILDFEEFCDLFKEYNPSIEKYVIDALPKKYKIFWQYFLDARKEVTESPSIFDLVRGKNIRYAEKYNYYFNKTCFNNLKPKLKEATITFTCADIKEVPEKFSKYDLIMLSTILNYRSEILGMTIGEAVALVEKFYHNNLNDFGELVYGYKYIYSEEIDDIYENINFGRKLTRNVDDGTSFSLEKGCD